MTIEALVLCGSSDIRCALYLRHVNKACFAVYIKTLNDALIRFRSYQEDHTAQKGDEHVRAARVFKLYPAPFIMDMLLIKQYIFETFAINACGTLLDNYQFEFTTVRFLMVLCLHGSNKIFERAVRAYYNSHTFWKSYRRTSIILINQKDIPWKDTEHEVLIIHDIVMLVETAILIRNKKKLDVLLAIIKTVLGKSNCIRILHHGIRLCAQSLFGPGILAFAKYGYTITDLCILERIVKKSVISAERYCNMPGGIYVLVSTVPTITIKSNSTTTIFVTDSDLEYLTNNLLPNMRQATIGAGSGP